MNLEEKIHTTNTYCYCSVAKLCPILCKPVNCSTTGFLVLQYLPEFALNSCPLNSWCHLTLVQRIWHVSLPIIISGFYSTEHPSISIRNMSDKSHFDRVNRGLNSLTFRIIGIEPTLKNSKFFLLPYNTIFYRKVS